MATSPEIYGLGLGWGLDPVGSLVLWRLRFVGVSLFYGCQKGQNVRPIGVDTPERGEKCYREATSRLRELAGGEVRVELSPRSKDRYGRLLYYVYTQDGDSIDEKSIGEGLGKAWERDGQHRELLIAVEDGAERTATEGYARLVATGHHQHQLVRVVD